MALTTLAKSYLNQLLKSANLKLETLTAAKAERKRLEFLEQGGHFKHPVFHLPGAFESKASELILEELPLHSSRFEDFKDSSRNDVGYTYNNDFFTSPDTEVLYANIRNFQPQTVVKIGCGNSTKIIRQAILDGQLKTRLISIDPHPRIEISKLADEFYLKPIEVFGDTELFRSLKEGDILFIDSSHEIKTGNDVVFLYLNVIPNLPPGVLLHIHDIFLPYDYPREWIVEEYRGWNEQYLVQLLLTYSSGFEVLWAGHFLQRTRRDFAQRFPHLGNRMAQSLWLRKTN